VKLTGTNRPITYTTHSLRERHSKDVHTRKQSKKITRLPASTMWFPTNKPVACEPTTEYNTTAVTPARPSHGTPVNRARLGAQHSCNTRFPHHTPNGVAGAGRRVTAVIAWGKRPVPFRTRKLRPTAPMVLHPGGCGRVGHRRTTITARPRHHVSGPSLINTRFRPTRFPLAQPAGPRFDRLNQRRHR
jgi:hypothetical protein